MSPALDMWAMVRRARQAEGSGTARQRRLGRTKRIQAHRKWWKHEGLALARAIVLGGRGGGIFGITNDTEL